MPTLDSKAKPARQDVVTVEVRPDSPVHVVGEPGLLWKGGPAGEFTPTEAAHLLALTDRHGSPVCRVVPTKKSKR